MNNIIIEIMRYNNAKYKGITNIPFSILIKIINPPAVKTPPEQNNG